MTVVAPIVDASSEDGAVNSVAMAAKTVEARYSNLNQWTAHLYLTRTGRIAAEAMDTWRPLFLPCNLLYSFNIAQLTGSLWLDVAI